MKHCSKSYLYWCQDFDKFGQVFVHYLMFFFNGIQIKRWVELSNSLWEIPLRIVQKKDRPEKISSYSNK